MRQIRRCIEHKPTKMGCYLIRTDPPMGKGIHYLLSHDNDSIHIGDFKDKKSKLSLSSSLKIKISDTVPSGDFYINAFADEGLWCDLQLLIAVNPTDGHQILSKINPYIREAVRHEIEHFTQRGDNLKISKKIRHNNSIRAKINSGLLPVYRYLILPDEIDANIHGLYAKAKSIKEPYQIVVDNHLDLFVKDGDLTDRERSIVYRSWKNRIPKIGGIPKLN